MKKSDYEKAEEIVKPYQTRINFILEELRENMVEAFGNSFNSSSFDAYMTALFYDTSENATDCGFKFDFHDDSCGDCYEKYFDTECCCYCVLCVRTDFYMRKCGVDGCAARACQEIV